MKNIITLGGSSSKNSINKQLVEYAGSFLKDINVINIDLNKFEMPLYSIDIENEHGFSESLYELNRIFENSDGFIVSLAEHNGAYTAAFKNVFDWLSRINGKVWRDKSMLLLSTSPGARGGQSVLDIAAARFPYMGGKIVGSLSIPSYYDNFKEGDLINTDLKSKLVQLIEEFEKDI